MSSASQRPSLIANKAKRAQVFAKLRATKKAEQKERRKKRSREEEAARAAGEEAPAKLVPRTLESVRDADDTFVTPDDAEVMQDEAEDEFAPYFSEYKPPKLIVTTKKRPTAGAFPFIRELLTTIPNSFYYRRDTHELKQICKYGENREFTHVLVVGEKAKRVNSLTVVHLPFGPTAFFRLTSSRMGWEIHNHGNPTKHLPEIILNNFNTRLGHRIGRFLGSMFPHRPEFVGRRVVTFHNQRDFIFLRHHRYIFAEDGRRARLQELGPRFTLRLKWLLAGTFDTKQGEYEWIHKRKELKSGKRRFYL